MISSVITEEGMIVLTKVRKSLTKVEATPDSEDG